jgi:hypothetical protein
MVSLCLRVLKKYRETPTLPKIKKILKISEVAHNPPAHTTPPVAVLCV